MNVYLIKYIAHGGVTDQKEFEAKGINEAIAKFETNYKFYEIVSVEKLKI